MNLKLLCSTWIHILYSLTIRYINPLQKQLCPYSPQCGRYFTLGLSVSCPVNLLMLFLCWLKTTIIWSEPKIKPLHWHFGSPTSSLGLGPSCSTAECLTCGSSSLFISLRAWQCVCSAASWEEFKQEHKGHPDRPDPLSTYLFSFSRRTTLWLSIWLKAQEAQRKY